MSSTRRRTRELAERTSNGTRVRLLWRHGTRHLWVEVREPDAAALAFTVQPERALDAFYHPYAYADLPDPAPPTESTGTPGRRPRVAREESREP